MYNSVLIVDDDPTQIAILKAFFAAQKIQNVHGATDATSALETLRNHHSEIELVVSDLQMPNMDGLEFIRHLKAMNYTGKLVLFSGVDEILLEHAGRLAKMHNLNLIGRLQKPLTKSAMDSVFLSEEHASLSRAHSPNVIITQDEFSNALQEDLIKPYYQPKVDVETGRIVGAEALARWFRLDTESVSPACFIQFAEDNGRIEDLTFALYRQVMKDALTFLQIDPDQQFAINLSPKLLANVSLPDKLSRIMREAGLVPENIMFEVTETSILNLDATTLEVLSRLRINGFEVAIDDFGTGSSNIQTLRDFPYSELKIDQSFVSTAFKNEFSAKTIRAAISLAKEMNMRTVAEGVERQRDLEILRAEGIDHVQGYLISKAISPLSYLEFIKRHEDGVSLPKKSNVA